MKNSLARFYSFWRRQARRYKDFTSIPRLMLVTAGLLLVVGITMAATRPTQVVSTKLPTPHQTASKAKTSAPSASSAAPAPSDTPATASSSPLAAAPSSTTTATTALAIALSSSSATVATGSQTPSFTATSQTGKPLSWTVLGTGSLLLVNGFASGSAEVSHSFSFTASLYTKPGTYTYTVTGYIPRGASVSKQFVVTVTQGPTFSLVALPADHSNDSTATSFLIPFEVRPLAGALSNVNISATIISSGGTAMSYGGIQDNGSGYTLNKAVVVYGNPTASTQIIVRVTVSDSAYTTSLDIPYDIN